MYRLLLTTILFTILYFLLRQMFRGFKNQRLNSRLPPDTPDLDQMIEDPVCHTFVPRQIAIVEHVGGRDYSFCSKECAATFRSKSQWAGQQPE